MRQDVFGVAYQEARAELLDISNKFDQLRQRKERLESVIAALAPMVGETAQPPAPIPVPVAHPVPVISAAAAPTAAPEPISYTFNQVETPGPGAEDANDPFQRRVRNALKFSNHREGLQHAS